MKRYSVTVDLIIYGDSDADAEDRARAMLLAATSEPDADLESYEVRDGLTEGYGDDFPDTQYDTLEERDAERELDRLNGLAE